MEIRVLLAGSCPLKNQGVCSNLLATNDAITLETTSEFSQLPRLCLSYHPHVLLIFIDDWQVNISPIFHHLPPVDIFALSNSNGHYCHTLIQKNYINGCLPESSSPELLVEALHAIVRGYTWFSKSLFKTAFRPRIGVNGNHAVLTERETAVMQLVMQEKTNKSIAQELGMCDRTVSSRLNAIYDKLGVESRVGAALKAERLGLFEKQTQIAR